LESERVNYRRDQARARPYVKQRVVQAQDGEIMSDHVKMLTSARERLQWLHQLAREGIILGQDPVTIRNAEREVEELERIVELEMKGSHYRKLRGW